MRKDRKLVNGGAQSAANRAYEYKQDGCYENHTLYGVLFSATCIERKRGECACVFGGVREGWGSFSCVTMRKTFQGVAILKSQSIQRVRYLY